MNLRVRIVRLAVFAGEAPDVVRVGVAQRNHVDRRGIDAGGPEIGEQAAAARAIHLAMSDAGVDQDQFSAGVDDERVLLDHEIVLVEEIGSQHVVDLFLAETFEHLRTKRAESKRPIGHDCAFESAELEAIGGGPTRLRRRAPRERCGVRVRAGGIS